MTNNNQPLKGLPGESVDQAAERFCHSKLNEFFSPQYQGFIAGANWQKQQPTEKESATVDEMADQRVKDAFNTWRNELRFEPKSSFDYFEAAYNMRDKEQAGAVDLIKEKIENYELEIMHDILSTVGIKHNKIRIELLTTILSQLK